MFNSLSMTLKVDAFENLRELLGFRHFHRHHSEFVESFKGIRENVRKCAKHHAFISSKDRRKMWQDRRWVCIMQKLANSYKGKNENIFYKIYMFPFLIKID